MGSFREIAQFMDSVVPPDSLRGLAEIHRWQNGIMPDTVSLRGICSRHNNTASQMKALFYNTWLLPGVSLETFCLSIRNKKRLRTSLAQIGEKPIRRIRARELARSIIDSGYDVVALCEIFDHDTRNFIIEELGDSVPATNQAFGPEPGNIISASLPVGVLTHTPGLPHIPVLNELLAISCPPFFIRSIGADPINSGLVTLGINKSLNNIRTMVYSNRGEPLKDSDYWSSKGVLRVEINIGFGNIEIYSTHIHFGGALLRDPTSEETNNVRRSQFIELKQFIEATHNPENICMVMGDFNCDGMNPLNPEYQFLVSEMDSIGFDDLWLLRARDEEGNSNPKPTTLLRDEGARVPYGNESCQIDDGLYCNDLIEAEISDPENLPARIDYIFMERQNSAHSFILDVTRPRRVPFRRDVITDRIEYISDHIGLEINLIASSI